MTTLGSPCGLMPSLQAHQEEVVKAALEWIALSQRTTGEKAGLKAISAEADAQATEAVDALDAACKVSEKLVKDAETTSKNWQEAQRRLEEAEKEAASSRNMHDVKVATMAKARAEVAAATRAVEEAEEKRARLVETVTIQAVQAGESLEDAARYHQKQSEAKDQSQMEALGAEEECQTAVVNVEASKKVTAETSASTYAVSMAAEKALSEAKASGRSAEAAAQEHAAACKESERYDQIAAAATAVCAKVQEATRNAPGFEEVFAKAAEVKNRAVENALPYTKNAAEMKAFAKAAMERKTLAEEKAAEAAKAAKHAQVVEATAVEAQTAAQLKAKQAAEKAKQARHVAEETAKSVVLALESIKEKKKIKAEADAKATTTIAETTSEVNFLTTTLEEKKTAERAAQAELDSAERMKENAELNLTDSQTWLEQAEQTAKQTAQANTSAALKRAELQESVKEKKAKNERLEREKNIALGITRLSEPIIDGWEVINAHMEEMFENSAKAFPLGEWELSALQDRQRWSATSSAINGSGKTSERFDEIEPSLPPGFVWINEWSIDKGSLSRKAIDEEGWTYSDGFNFNSIVWPPNSGAGESAWHGMSGCRQRRYTRLRAEIVQVEAVGSSTESEGGSASSLFNSFANIFS